jgi:putative transposase
MPRRARLSLAGIPWHIIQQGNNRSVCFHAEDDYQFYLHCLKAFADKFGCALHAYGLMTRGKAGRPTRQRKGNDGRQDDLL